MAELQKVEHRMETLRKFFEENRAKVAAILPKHFSPDRQGQLLFTMVYKNPDLLDCTPASLVGAVMQGGMLGLEPVGPGGYWLVPFYQKANPGKGLPARRNVSMIIDYRGLMGMARRTKEVRLVDWRPVRVGDKFEYEYGTQSFLRHTPSPEPVHLIGPDGKPTEREITHFYAFGVLTSGSEVFEVMRREDVEWHRDRYSKAAGGGPWITNFDEMGAKTCVRKLADKLPFDPLLSKAVEIDAKTEQGVADNFAAFLGDLGGDGSAALDRLTNELKTRDSKQHDNGGVSPESPGRRQPEATGEPAADGGDEKLNQTSPAPLSLAGSAPSAASESLTSKAPTSAPASDGPPSQATKEVSPPKAADPRVEGARQPVGGPTTHGLIDAINQAYADLDMAGSKDAGKRSFLWVRYIGAAVGPEKASVEQLTKLKDYLVDLVGKKRAQS